MKILLSLIASLIAILAAGIGAQAAEEWQLLGTQEINPSIDQVVIDLSKREAAIKGVRLAVKSGSITLSRVVVTYRGGREHVEERKIILEAGERTRPIDPRDQELIVEKVRLHVGKLNSKQSRVIVEVWGLTSTSGAAHQGDAADTLNSQVEKLYGEGKYSEAIPLAQSVLAIREKALGAEHPDVATALNSLALLYRDQGRYADAEPLYQRALTIFEKGPGAEHPDFAELLNNLAGLYQDQGRYADAEPLYKRALAIDEKALGTEHPDFATDLDNLATLYRDQGRYGEAEPLCKRVLAIDEKALGTEHPDFATALNNLSELYRVQGRYADAEPLYQRALAISEKAFGAEHPSFATALNNLANLHQDQGRYADAEPLYKRSLAIRDKALGAEHPDVALSLNGLAALYWNQGRYADAEPLYKRALAVFEKAHGGEHPNVATALDNLANLYQDQGRYADAEPLYERVLATREKAHGAGHPNVAYALNNLAMLYEKQGRYADAVPLCKRALAIFEKAHGPEHPNVASSLNNLAELYKSQGRYADAEPLYRRALAIREKGLGAEHPNVALSLNGLAWLSFVQSEWAGAADYWRRATRIIERRAERGLAKASDVNDSAKSESERNDWYFWGLVKAARRLAVEKPGSEPGLVAEMFLIAQSARSSQAAGSLAQMAARGATGNANLAALARERQDLVAEWQNGDSVRTAALSQPPDKRDKQAEVKNAARISEIDTRIAVIDRQLVKDFPDYAALVTPKSLSIGDVQAQLGDDEALVLFLDTPERKPTPEETFIWVVTRMESRWVKSDLGTEALAASVAKLRCGLDRDGNWTWSASKRRWLARDQICAALRSDGFTDREGPPFDLAAAHELYRGLFGQVEDLIKDKSLLIVPSGPLTRLPFQVLVTEPPTSAQAANPVDYGAAAWFINSHAVTVLPSVASLEALRRHAKASQATGPFAGFGNPLLLGRGGDDRRAWSHQSCGLSPEIGPVEVAERGVSAELSEFFRGGLALVSVMRRQAPLPETADELCSIARDLGAPEDDVHLGQKATETEVKAMSRDGTLAAHRIVDFATHGLIAGESESIAKAKAEPALLLTPPDIATEEDDGLLTASEVAQLKLDADWVVLSACNTAAGGDKSNAEPLSGLARAFFYAGARALLVTHWYVDSRAAVKITTGAFAELRRDPTIGRSEALRRSMLAAMNDAERPLYWTPPAHPAVWAPFVLVGEGSKAEQ